MENGSAKKSSSLEWLLLAVFVLALATQLTNEFNNPDGIGYYAHLRSAAVDRDLFHLDEFETLGMSPYFYSPSPTGYIRNQWPAGSALLWAPFFAAGRVMTIFSGADAGGYSAFDSLVITFASAFYGFLALWLCLKMLKRRFSGFAGFAAVAGAWLGTSFFCYQFHFAALAHSCSAFTATLFVYLWQREREERSAAGWVLMGCAAALAAMVRTELVLLAALPVMDLLFKRGRGRQLRGLVVFAAIAFVCFAPQMVVWWALNGSPLSSYQGAVNTLPANPHTREVLFSAYHGLLPWSPVVGLALIGWVLLLRRDAAGAVGFFTVFAALLYVNGAMIWWWAGGAFGARLFVGLFPLFAWGLAEFLGRIPKVVGIPLVVVCVGWTGLLLLQFLSGAIYLEKFYPFGELVDNSREVLAHPAAHLKAFATPKLGGVSVPAAVVGMGAAAAALFLTVKSISGRLAAGRAGTALICLCLLAAIWLAFCWSNTDGAAARNAAGLERAATYSLEELYEPFPLQYADYYVRAGRIDDALKEFQRLEKLVPDNPAVPVAQAGIYMMLGNKQLARAKAEKAARMPMRHPATRRTLRRILLDLEYE